MSGKQNENLPSKGMMVVRIFVGGYLLYLSYALMNDSSNTIAFPLLVLIVAVFGVSGILILVFTIRRFLQGRYIGAPADDSEMETIEAEKEKKE